MFSNRRTLFHETFLVFGGLLTALLFLMLLTYSPNDPAWTSLQSADTETKIQNRLGMVGAYVADILFAMLGNSSYLLCIIIFIALRGTLSSAGKGERIGGWWCALGLLLFILSSAALERIRFSAFAVELPNAAGGAIGELVAGGMLGLFGETGSVLILLCIWIVSWSLSSNLSWFSFCELIGERVEKIFFAAAAALERRRNLRRGKIAGLRRAAAAEELRRTTPHTLSISSSAAKKPVRSRPHSASKPAAAQLPLADLSARTPVSSEGLWDRRDDSRAELSPQKLEEMSALIKETLKSFGIAVEVLAAHPGPVITRYDIRPEAGVKGAQIVSLVRDIARALSVSGIRVLETIPGKDCMGLEIPNQIRETVYFEDLIEDDSYLRDKHILPLALGKNALGAPLVADLTKMPHLLVAGATGSGKSVCINAMLLSLLLSSPPDKMRLILIDPKMLELASYNDIPHLLAPVITDVTQVPAVLNWAVGEMESRYRMMSETGARNIDSYNRQIADSADGENKPLPYIVIVIDELADLMMTTGKKVEMTISRLAQKARAAGIHLILATQRPSVDVITGLIKANVPCRIAFQVASKVDSRTIIDQMGAEMLLGMGDMLYLPAGTGTPQRVHGAFVSDGEVSRTAERLRESGERNYEIDFSVPPSAAGAEDETDAESDEMYDQAVETVLSTSRPSISLVQRKLRIGYNRAARLIEAMERAGIISPPDENGVRKIIAPNK